MLLTDKEAREKWCPHMPIYVPGGVLSRDGAFIGNKKPNGNCIASECMAWRWEKDPDFLEVDEVPRGYCGAFGRPAGAPL